MTDEKKQKAPKQSRTVIYVEDYPTLLKWIGLHCEAIEKQHGYRPTKKQAFAAFVNGYEGGK